MKWTSRSKTFLLFHVRANVLVERYCGMLEFELIYKTTFIASGTLESIDANLGSCSSKIEVLSLSLLLLSSFKISEAFGILNLLMLELAAH